MNINLWTNLFNYSSYCFCPWNGFYATGWTASKVQTIWSKFFKWQFYLPMSIMRPRELRFSSESFGMFTHYCHHSKESWPTSFAHLYHFSLKKKSPPQTCAVILTKGFCSFPQCRGNSKEDTCVTFTNYSSKTKSELLQNVIQALDLNSKHGEERWTEKTKYKKHSNAEQRA